MSCQCLERARPYQLKTSPLSSHGRILECLSEFPRNSRILDVGTADGYLGQILRNMGFEHIVGLEHNSIHLQTARTIYTQMIEHDLDLIPSWSLSQQFDIIICADVLEHMRDPWVTLEWLVQLLAPGGRILISVPNGVHWWVRLNVLLGRFPLDDRGLFDRGHLRFFTRSTLYNLLDKSGLMTEKEWITPIPFTLIVSQSTAYRIARLAEIFYCRVAHLWKQLFAYQFVLLTVRRSQ